MEDLTEQAKTRLIVEDLAKAQRDTAYTLGRIEIYAKLLSEQSEKNWLSQGIRNIIATILFLGGILNASNGSLGGVAICILAHKMYR